MFALIALFSSLQEAHAGGVGLYTQFGMHQGVAYYYDVYGKQGIDSQFLPHYGAGFEGIGIGRASIFKYAALWITFLLLTVCIVNILIAVISDGYEIHKDNQRLRTKGGETIIKYGWHRFLYHIGYQFNTHFRKTQEHNSWQNQNYSPSRVGIR